MMRKGVKFYLGLNKGASDVFEGDPWFRSFAMEIKKLYGYPTSSTDTLSKQGRILSAYATVNITTVSYTHLTLPTTERV